MDRRTLLKAALALGLGGTAARLLAADDPAVSVDALAALSGKLTVYLGHGEGGLYTDIVGAIRERNPALDLSLRRAPSSALATTLVAEAGAGGPRADLFWSVDAASLAVVNGAGMGRRVPDDIRGQIRPEFRYDRWAALSGRIRSLPYNTGRLSPADLPGQIMDLPDSDLRVGWAPSYAAFQTFIAAMRLLEGEARTRRWLEAMKSKAQSYAGELGVVLATARGEVDVGLANHYYTLRLKSGDPDASVALAFTRDDAGCLVNAAGTALLSGRALPADFTRYLLTREVQSFLAEQAYEIPLVAGVAPPAGLPSMDTIQPPELDLARLSELKPALALLRDTGVL
ncbi:MAG: substrate-binding domain-containing protein [Salinisphaeraceae bacterium]